MSRDTWRTIACISLIAAAVVVSACSGSGAPETPEIVLAEGCDLRSSAGAGERKLIATLLDGTAEGAAVLAIDYPRDGSVFPPEMVAPTFLWHDPSAEADRWLVEFSFGDGTSGIRLLIDAEPFPQGEIDPRCLGEANKIYEPTPYQASSRSWKPSDPVWAAIKELSLGKPAEVRFAGFDGDHPDKILSSGRMTLSTSLDRVEAPIFYRDVPLLPSKTKDGVIKPLAKGAVPLITWRLRDISRTDNRLLLEDMPTCTNCHSFSADGRTMGMDIDGPNGDKGAYGIVPVKNEIVIEADQVISWNRFEGRPEGHMTLGFLSNMSPDGNRVVTTVNEELYVQNFMDYRFSQVFYPTRGILAWYSRETGEINTVPGADDPGYVHCDAVWTPDGEWLIFARAKAREAYPAGRPRATHAGDPNETPMRYDLYRIPFNNGAGGRPEPIEGASANGMSNTFPKVSPDGEWIVFVKCGNGQLMRPDSRLWIVPAAGGEAREMNCNLPVMNSWHSFSPNGRWLVFSSKSDSPYTRMYLTHIDDDGNDTPAILIEGSTAANRAVNIPEFINISYDQLDRIRVPAVDHWRYLTKGAALAREGKHQDAIAMYERALAGEWHEWRSNDWKTHSNMGQSLMALRRWEEAVEHFRRSLSLHPDNPEAHTNLAYALIETGNHREAETNLDAVVRIMPDDPKSWFNRGTFRMNTGNLSGAHEDYTEAIRLEPSYAEAYGGRGSVLMMAGDLSGALSDFDHVARLQPTDPMPFYFRAMVLLRKGDLAGAAADAEMASRLVDRRSARLADIEKLKQQIGAAMAAAR